MFVRAVVRVRVGEGGAVVPPDLRGKWTCPMHPDVVNDTAGHCPSCEMPLVRGTAAAESPRPALVVPATAPLVTGRRAVVYVEKAEGTYEGRDVTLGPRAGDRYVVRDGLREGERVVIRGGFKLDSSLQIQGRPSMMQPATEEAAKRETPGGGERASGEKEPGAKVPKPQTHCPVMGGEIAREHYADYRGQRVYFCCPGCTEPFLKEPEKYLAKMRAEGIQPEPTPGGAAPVPTAPASEHRH
jgi:Cu(I)/Ag(I) efflux system membrane fusion protein